MIDLEARRVATEKVIAKYRDRRFDWRTGATCLHLLGAQLRAMGRRPRAVPRFRSAIGARRAMAQAGFADVAAVVDSVLPLRIPPAMMVVGDIGLLPGEPGGFDAIVICVGGKMLGWHERADGLAVIDAPLSDFIAAWRT